MMSRGAEMEAMKSRINLTEYAAFQGYVLDRRASSRNSAVMDHPRGDKIIVGKGTDQHWIYFSVRDFGDNGSIIDFVQNRQGGSLGDVRIKLRPWLSGPPADHRPPSEAFVPSLQPVSRNLVAVRAQYLAMDPIQGHHDYLEHQRHIPPHYLTDDRFSERIRVDAYGNVVFPHWNREGICGFEIKNQGFTGFARGGEKGLWCSRPTAEDRILVVAETAIDALSYAALHQPPTARYVSTAGQISVYQRGLLESAFLKLPEDSEIILAMDNDPGGHSLAEQIQAVFAAIDAPGCVLRVHLPQNPGEDWNDALRASTGQERDAEVLPTPGSGLGKPSK